MKNSLNIFAILFFGLQAFAKADQTSFSVMTYNVENLFDAQDDAERDDETYLPLSEKQSAEHKKKCKRQSGFKFRKDCYQLDWNQSVIASKMKNLASVILSVENGRGPDILLLVEVENIRILNQFNDTFLKAAGYKTVQLIEGQDPRGIDLALLSRFDLASRAELIPLHIEDEYTSKKKKTRGVFRVPLKIEKNLNITLFAVHLPSQGSSTLVRSQGLKSLNSILKKEKNPWIAGGDFNIIEKENKEFQLIENYLEPLGDIAHKIGCNECEGTHNYKGKWSFLDLLVFDHRLKAAGIVVDRNSIKVVKHPQMMGKKDKPKRFVPDKGQGASDHFPVYSRLFVQKAPK